MAVRPEPGPGPVPIPLRWQPVPSRQKRGVSVLCLSSSFCCHVVLTIPDRPDYLNPRELEKLRACIPLKREPSTRFRPVTRIPLTGLVADLPQVLLGSHEKGTINHCGRSENTLFHLQLENNLSSLGRNLGDISHSILSRKIELVANHDRR